jgi:hypothetical protein
LTVQQMAWQWETESVLLKEPQMEQQWVLHSELPWVMQ